MCLFWNCSLATYSKADASVPNRKGDDHRPNGRHLS